MPEPSDQLSDDDTADTADQTVELTRKRDAMLRDIVLGGTNSYHGSIQVPLTLRVKKAVARMTAIGPLLKKRLSRLFFVSAIYVFTVTMLALAFISTDVLVHPSDVLLDGGYASPPHFSFFVALAIRWTTFTIPTVIPAATLTMYSPNSLLTAIPISLFGVFVNAVMMINMTLTITSSELAMSSDYGLLQTSYHQLGAVYALTLAIAQLLYFVVADWNLDAATFASSASSGWCALVGGGSGASMCEPGSTFDGSLSVPPWSFFCYYVWGVFGTCCFLAKLTCELNILSDLATGAASKSDENRAVKFLGVDRDIVVNNGSSGLGASRHDARDRFDDDVGLGNNDPGYEPPSALIYGARNI
jgi:hypothetical protein